MKGFLRGIKYVSHIFEGEKEPEMQIGLPTDVKHVAHIGMDCPTVAKPSWMNEFNSEIPTLNPSNGDQLQLLPPPPGSQDSLSGNGSEKPKKSGGKQSVGSSPSAGSEKSTRRQRTPEESANRDPSSDEKQQRRSSHDTKSSSQVPDIPKKYRQKKSKRSCGGSEASLSPAVSNFEIKA
ncbi:Ubiquitin 4, putative isoform 1 [Hibiscus syriacus]|uniref:Ubiquitin 4, putative isoform 1 n=1 Tax=Hibiscus syriacus TaxID=106335 RepID=A0A6A3D2I3_HIBSY|nr:CRIB domain-containing protein RIC5-like [Hibiscus syriacus]KAE8735975.1 Ubiquitin 4, putative isoform 1 [Hibiscus syriacus]